jgi:hypothetical protein
MLRRRFPEDLGKRGFGAGGFGILRHKVMKMQSLVTLHLSSVEFLECVLFQVSLRIAADGSERLRH